MINADKYQLYYKFPVILRDKLLAGEIILPDTVLFTYNKILTYRAAERSVKDNHLVTIEDFKSYYELKKKPKIPRGMKKRF